MASRQSAAFGDQETQEHPAYEENVRARGIDQAALVRKHTPEAIELFREKMQPQSSARQ
jgi:hypothetical protein